MMNTYARLQTAARYAERQNRSAGQRAADHMDTYAELGALDDVGADLAELRARLDVRKAEAGNVSVATLAFLTLALVPVGLVATFVGSLVGAIAGTF